MLKRFFNGQCSLAEAFWKYSVIGITVCSFVARLFMILLKQTVGYNVNYLKVMFKNLAFLNMDPMALLWFCCYAMTFLVLVGYSVICFVGMGRTYKEYEKSKILAFICLVIVVIIAYIGIKLAIY